MNSSKIRIKAIHGQTDWPTDPYKVENLRLKKIFSMIFKSVGECTDHGCNSQLWISKTCWLSGYTNNYVKK